MVGKGIQLGVLAPALSPDPRQAARLARQFGFSGLLFDATSNALDIAGLPASGRREFRHTLSSQDQQLIGLRSDLGPKGLGIEADVDQALSRLTRAMEAAAQLAAPLVCVDLGPLPPAPRPVSPKPTLTPQQAGLILVPEPARQPPPPAQAENAPDPRFVAQVQRALAELGGQADRFNVIVAFRSELSSLASLCQALRLADCPWFGVDLDPVAVLRDTWDIDEVFSQLGGSIRHVRGRDAAVGADRRTLSAIIGRGSVAWAAVLSNLDAAAFSGWLSVDPADLTDRTAAAASALTHLRKLL